MTEAVRFTKRYGDVGEAKFDGVTYTPRALADFVADRIVGNREPCIWAGHPGP